MKQKETIPVNAQPADTSSSNQQGGNGLLLYEAKYSIPEAADLLHIGQTQLRKLVVGGVIPSKRIGNKYILFERDLEAFLSDGRGVEQVTVPSPPKKSKLPQEVIESKHLN